MTTPRAKWANDRLSAWLREDTEGTALDLLEGIKDAVEHLMHCTGWECGEINHDHHATGKSGLVVGEAGPSDKCASPCLDCKAYREGQPGLYAGTRPVWDLIQELDYLLDRKENVA